MMTTALTLFSCRGDGMHPATGADNAQRRGHEQLKGCLAHSPDLNPIENAWSIVQRHLEKVYPTTEAGLWKAMTEGWEKIDEATLLQLTGSVSRRLQAVKAAQGGHTKY